MSRLLVTSIRAVLMDGGGKSLTEVGSSKTGKRGNGR